jgi:hypothetical protein
MIAGFSASNPSNYNFIERTDSLGNPRWRRSYHTGITSAYQVTLLALPDGGALWVGPLKHPNSTGIRTILLPTVMRLDSAGNVMWQRSYGESYGEGNLYTVEPVPDGSYLLTGYQPRPIPGPGYLVSDAWVLRITPDGDTIRSRYISTGSPLISEVANTGHLLPNGGVLLSGSVRTSGSSTLAQGWVAWLDSLDRLQTSYLLPQRNQYASELRHAIPLAGPDSAVLVTGYRGIGYVGQYSRRQGQVSLRWEQDIALPTGLGALSTDFVVLAPNQELTLSGPVAAPAGTPRPGILTRFTNAGVPYQPELCRTPPVVNATFVRPPASPDSLNLFDLSDAGPRYGQLVRWRWSLGDGTAVERTQPGWVRHKYATLPAPGTPVTLTLTNNLGCTSSQTLYPFGRPSASQQSQAMAARATLFPNPGSGAVTLTLTDAPAGLATVQLLNSLGQVVQAYTPRAVGSTLSLPLDVSALPSGVYALRISTRQGSFVKRLVRQ